MRYVLERSRGAFSYRRREEQPRLRQAHRGQSSALRGYRGMALPYVMVPPFLLLGREGMEGQTMTRHRTNQEHVQAVREGKDYYSPKLAINETIDHLVDCAMIVKNHDVPLTAETRALDAIGVQVVRELKNRAEMIHALTDRIAVLEGELEASRELFAKQQKELAHVVQQVRVQQTPRKNFDLTDA